LSESEVDDIDARGRNLRTVELTPREARVLLQYGYPFAEQEQKLRDSKAAKGCHRVPTDAYWIEMMLADLVRSAREIRSRALLEELDELTTASARRSPAQSKRSK